MRIDSPAQAVKLGIGMVHQHFMLVEAMTVFENIILGDRNTKGVFIDREARKRRSKIYPPGMGWMWNWISPLRKFRGAQQRVEILKGLISWGGAANPGRTLRRLDGHRGGRLVCIMRKLTSEGKSIIFISHKMREVLRISDRITILRAGQTVRTVNREETTGEELANLMIGRELTPSHYEKITAPGEPVVSLEKVDYHKESKHNGLSGVSLSVGRGEIVASPGWMAMARASWPRW